MGTKFRVVGDADPYAGRVYTIILNSQFYILNSKKMLLPKQEHFLVRYIAGAAEPKPAGNWEMPILPRFSPAMYLMSEAEMVL